MSETFLKTALDEARDCVVFAAQNSTTPLGTKDTVQQVYPNAFMTRRDLPFDPEWYTNLLYEARFAARFVEASSQPLNAVTAAYENDVIAHLCPIRSNYTAPNGDAWK